MPGLNFLEVWVVETLSRKSGSVRKACTSDAEQLFAIINSHAVNEVMLERSLENIYDNLRDFFVADTF